MIVGGAPRAWWVRSPRPDERRLDDRCLRRSNSLSGKFRCLTLARAVVARDDAAPVVLNAANEVAVAAFLEGRIRFTQIAELIERTLETQALGRPGSIEECVAIDGAARRLATDLLPRQAGGRAS